MDSVLLWTDESISQYFSFCFRRNYGVHSRPETIQEGVAKAPGTTLIFIQTWDQHILLAFGTQLTKEF